MGADYYASVIVGVKVPTTKLYEKKTVKAFPHNHPEDWSVDPKTGNKLWVKEDVFLLEGVVSEDNYDWVHHKKDAKAVVIFDSEGRSRSDLAFIGRHMIEINVGNGDGAVSLPDVNMNVEKKFLEDLLTPHGFWREKNFGIWLVGRVSC